MQLGDEVSDGGVGRQELDATRAFRVRGGKGGEVGQADEGGEHLFGLVALVDQHLVHDSVGGVGELLADLGFDVAGFQSRKDTRLVFCFVPGFVSPANGGRANLGTGPF